MYGTQAAKALRASVVIEQSTPVLSCGQAIGVDLEQQPGTKDRSEPARNPKPEEFADKLK